MRRDLSAIETGPDAARLMSAERFLGRVRKFRGELSDSAPEELRGLGPDIVSALNRVRDPALRSMLIASLGLTQHPEAVQALLDLIDHETDPVLLTRLLDSVASAQDPISVPVIRRLCQSDSTLVRKTAVYHLAAWKDKASLPLIRSKLDEPGEEVRWTAAFSLAHFFQENSGFPVLVRMLDRDYLKRFLDPLDEASIQRAMLMAVRGLRTLGDRAAIEPIRRIFLRETNEAVKSACKEALHHLEK